MERVRKVTFETDRSKLTIALFRINRVVYSLRTYLYAGGRTTTDVEKVVGRQKALEAYRDTVTAMLP